MRSVALAALSEFALARADPGLLLGVSRDERGREVADRYYGTARALTQIRAARLREGPLTLRGADPGAPSGGLVDWQGLCAGDSVFGWWGGYGGALGEGSTAATRCPRCPRCP